MKSVCPHWLTQKLSVWHGILRLNSISLVETYVFFWCKMPVVYGSIYHSIRGAFFSRVAESLGTEFLVQGTPFRDLLATPRYKIALGGGFRFWATTSLVGGSSWKLSCEKVDRGRGPYSCASTAEPFAEAMNISIWSLKGNKQLRCQQVLAVDMDPA